METPGSGRPDGGPPEEISGLPAEWGRIVIPDDAAALATEAAQVRRELRGQTDPGHRSGRAAAAYPGPALRLPLLVMTVALLTTLVSLVAVIWPDTSEEPAAVRRATDGGPTSGGTGGRPRTARTTLEPLPALDLVDERGRPVALRALLPAVIVFVDHCDCPAQLRQSAATVPPGVTVIALTSGSSVPSPVPRRTGESPTAGILRSLADPTGELRAFLGLDPGAPDTVLAARSGRVVRVLPGQLPPGGYQEELAGLASG